MELKLLLITNKSDHDVGGREQLCNLNRSILKDIYKEKFSIVEVKKFPPVFFFEKVATFRGYIDGINIRTIRRIM